MKPKKKTKNKIDPDLHPIAKIQLKNLYAERRKRKKESLANLKEIEKLENIENPPWRP
ncbi:MAG: hypothetical protein HQK65_10650 [Desulfamplus sp.]|nr:hypothetical protein [Desulfamplus sp.]